MNESNTRGRVFPLPLGLIGAIAIVALAERTVSRFDLDLSEVTTMNWSFSRHAARSEARHAEILCLGTSLIKFGMLPRSLENATGHTSYNLGVCNGHMPTSYFLLERALAAGARPIALLVDCQDGPVAKEDRGRQAEALRVNVRNWPELLSPTECIDLAWTARDPSFLADTFVARALPSYKSRFEVRNLVTAAFQGRNGSPRETVLIYLRNWNANLGANVMPSSVTISANNDPPKPLANHVPDHFADGTWLPNPLTETYIKRFLALTDEHKIPVFWILPPVPAAAAADRQRAGMDRYFDDLARRAQAMSANVTVVDGSRSNYPAETFCDKAHMNAAGTASFSESVAAVVASSLVERKAGGGWVRLPDYSTVAGKAKAAFEDIEGSRIAVKEGRIGLRR